LEKRWSNLKVECVNANSDREEYYKTLRRGLAQIGYLTGEIMPRYSAGESTDALIKKAEAALVKAALIMQKKRTATGGWIED
jgi:hypothetical protein